MLTSALCVAANLFHCVPTILPGSFWSHQVTTITQGSCTLACPYHFRIHSLSCFYAILRVYFEYICFLLYAALTMLFRSIFFKDHCLLIFCVYIDFTVHLSTIISIETISFLVYLLCTALCNNILHDKLMRTQFLSNSFLYLLYLLFFFAKVKFISHCAILMSIFAGTDFSLVINHLHVQYLLQSDNNFTFICNVM